MYEEVHLSSTRGGLQSTRRITVSSCCPSCKGCAQQTLFNCQLVRVGPNCRELPIAKPHPSGRSTYFISVEAELKRSRHFQQDNYEGPFQVLSFPWGWVRYWLLIKAPLLSLPSPVSSPPSSGMISRSLPNKLSEQ